MRRLTAKSEALAFRIWAACEPAGWDRTPAEVADMLDVPPSRVRRIAQLKGWTTRLRADGRDGPMLRRPPEHVAEDVEIVRGLRGRFVA